MFGDATNTRCSCDPLSTVSRRSDCSCSLKAQEKARSLAAERGEESQLDGGAFRRMSQLGDTQRTVSGQSPSPPVVLLLRSLAQIRQTSHSSASVIQLADCSHSSLHGVPERIFCPCCGSDNQPCRRSPCAASGGFGEQLHVCSTDARRRR